MFEIFYPKVEIAKSFFNYLAIELYIKIVSDAAVKFNGSTLYYANFEGVNTYNPLVCYTASYQNATKAFHQS